MKCVFKVKNGERLALRIGVLGLLVLSACISACKSLVDPDFQPGIRRVQTAPLVAPSPAPTFPLTFPMDATGASSVYTFNSLLIDFVGGIARLSPASQTDSSNACLGFGDGVTPSCGGTWRSGVLWDSSRSVIRVGTSNDDRTLSSDWTPAWSNLVGYWKLDGTPGTLSDGTAIAAAVGSAGVFSNSDGSVAPQTDYLSGQVGQGIQFDGSDDFVDLGNPAAVQFDRTSAYTLSAWIKTPPASGNSGAIIGKMDDSNVFTGYDLWYCNNAGAFYGCTPGGIKGHLISDFWAGDALAVNTSPLAKRVDDNLWHHVAVTYSGSGTASGITIYIDGVSQPVEVSYDSLTGSTLTSVPLKIGSRDANNPFVGAIDEVAIWNTALSPSAVQAIYQHQGAKYAGVITSRVIDAYVPGQSWTTLSWTPTLPFQKPLPVSSSDWVLSWSFDETALSGGLDFADRSGNSNTGSAHGGVTLGGIGQIQKGITLDGTTGYVSSQKQYLGPINFTVSAWFKTTTSQGGKIVGYEMDQVGVGTSSNYDRHLFMLDDGRVAFGIFTPGPVSGVGVGLSYSGSPLNDGAWHHAVGTYGSGTLKLYIDGALSASQSLSWPENVQGYWRVGCGMLLAWPNQPTSNCFAGSIDEVNVWHRTLSTSEVLSLYVDGLAGQTSTLSGYDENAASYSSLATSSLMSDVLALWHMDESAGLSVAQDATTSSFNGTATAVTFGAQGALGTSAAFDGVSSQIALPYDIELIFQNITGFTISAWVYPNQLPMSGNWTNQQQVFNVSDSPYLIADPSGTPGWSFGFIDITANDYFVSTTQGYDNSTWHHLVGTYDGSTLNLYVDGVLAATQAVSSAFYPTGVCDSSGICGFIGRSPDDSVPRYFKGNIDEVAVWRRALTQAEVVQLYRRGANRIKFQVRSCSDATCTTGSPGWKGPNGTDQTYFSELYNTASNSLTGAVQAGLPSILFSNLAGGGLSVANQRYFQYRVVLESDDGNTLCDYGSGPAPCSPELRSVTIGPDHYDTSLPTISNQSGVSFQALSSLTETLGAANGCPGGIRYVLSRDGMSWYYWTGAAWGLSNSSYAQANSAATLNANLSTFATQVGTGSLYFKAFLKSNGLQPCELDALTFGGQ